MAAYVGPVARLLYRSSVARYPLAACSSNCSSILWTANASANKCNLAVRRALSSSAPVQDTVHQRIKGRRRFYKTVSVRPVEGEENAWEILLDRHVLRTPGRRPLRLPTETLARAVAAEWDAQVAASGIEPTVMPLMTLTATAIDQIAVQPAVTIENVMRYLPTDTVCFFAPEYDRIMRKRQHQRWEPLHQWMSQSVGAELGRTMDNLARPKHDPTAVSKVQSVVEALDPFTLSAVQCITMECKSLVIALAVAHRHISIEQVCNAIKLCIHILIHELFITLFPKTVSIFASSNSSLCSSTQ